MRLQLITVGSCCVCLLLAGCSSTADDTEAALESASSVQSSVMASVESEASVAAAPPPPPEPAPPSAFHGDGAEMPAPEGFDPLGTGMVYQGAYQLTPTTVAELQEAYASTGGAVDIDLTGLQPIPEDHRLAIYAQNGPVTVFLPNTISVQMECVAEGAVAECSPELYNPEAGGGIFTLAIESYGGPITVIPTEGSN